ncbi:hypothetical protein N7454_001503 [Penicillium verhagenii]|nr:hypothetical protein N7454_001503 [Penicillium verhagenii]
MLVSYSLFSFVIFVAWAGSLESSNKVGRIIAAPISQATCSGQHYDYNGLAAYGSVPSNATDQYGDTLSGFGSAVFLNQSSWSKDQDGSYNGIIWALPDRGWNANGTLNYQPRIHRFSINVNLSLNGSGSDPSPPNIQMVYLDSILLTGPDGVPITSLDADVAGYKHHPNHIGLRRPSGGFRWRFWISDEYGPYIYRFSKHGNMLHAIQPPLAFLPLRNDTLSFSGGEPPMLDPHRVIDPVDPTTGRANNQGLEGLSISPDGRYLYAMMQSAMIQEGGSKKKHRRHARLLTYDISDKELPLLSEEHVISLPLYDTSNDPGKSQQAALQSDILQLSNGHLLILARDSGFGRGRPTDLVNGAIASSKGVLYSDIKTATYCPFLDFNLGSELKKFGLHNGGDQDSHLLNEKWESLALAPLSERDWNEAPEYLLFSFSDNDFRTQEGHLNFGKFRFSDAAGQDIDTQILAFRMSYGQPPADRHKMEL